MFNNNSTSAPYAGKVRISRRSISKHNANEKVTSSMDILKGILKTPFDINDKEKSLEKIDLNPLASFIEDHKDTSRSLEQIRFLSTINKGQFSTTSNKTSFADFEKFHRSIIESREKVKPIYAYLTNFDEELSLLSNEMESLQSRSNLLNDQLESKRKLEQKLAPILLDLAVPPDVIKSVIKGEVNSSWVENIRFINEKKQFIESSSYDYKDTKAMKELEKNIELLTLKCVERIRDFLIKQIKLLRAHGTPSQVVQNRLLQTKEIFPFLKENHSLLAEELKQAYIYTMRWYYSNQFSRYLYSLEKLNQFNIDKSVLLGNDEYTSKGNKFLNIYPSSSKPEKSISLTEYLSLGNRIGILTAQDPTVLVSQIAENNPLTYWMETGFRSFNLALVDNGTVEYLFLNEFFQLDEKFEEIDGVFEQIFSKTFLLGISYTKKLIAESFDSYGILICIRLTQSLEYELQHRRIPVMESYLKLQVITLWPRFQQIIDANCENMRRAALKTTYSNINSSAPHQITQHFAIYLSGLLQLTQNSSQMTEKEQSEPLSTSIGRLRNDFESVLTKISNHFGKGKGENKELFLYNNYFLILTILNENDENQLAKEQREHFKLLTEAYKSRK